jgi:hypothetical protein
MRSVAETGESVLVERSGARQVAIIPVEAYDEFVRGRHASPRWEDDLDLYHELVRKEQTRQPTQSVAELFEEMRQERSEQSERDLL